MGVLRVIKFIFLGIVGQILILSLLSLIVSSEIGLYIYWPWMMGGEWLFPSGPGGHAMPGGAILGALVGFIVNSLILGFGIDRLIKWYLVKRKEWF